MFVRIVPSRIFYVDEVLLLVCRAAINSGGIFKHNFVSVELFDHASVDDVDPDLVFVLFCVNFIKVGVIKTQKIRKFPSLRITETVKHNQLKIERHTVC